MIRQLLTTNFKLGRLYNSWLISAGDVASAVVELELFIKETLLPQEIDLVAHPDFKKIGREQERPKGIVVDQIMELHGFLSKTSGLSGSKVAIIAEADLMNINAAGACLKILEDTPKSSYIFLVTSRAGSILPTIRSRCAKINLAALDHHSTTYEESISLLLHKGSNLENRLAFLKKFSEKNRRLWSDFAGDILYFIAKLVKHSAGVRQNFSISEQEVSEQLSSTSPSYLIKKYEKINTMVNEIDYLDLELQSASLLLISYFNE